MDLLRLIERFRAAHDRLHTEDDRGDVPGWVLVTLMTAGLVAAMWAVASPIMSDLLGRALNSVTGP